MNTERMDADTSRPKYLHNRHIIIKRDRRRDWSQRYESGWDCPFGTVSHHDYHSFFVAALAGAVLRKIGAEIGHWLLSHPTKSWRLP